MNRRDLLVCSSGLLLLGSPALTIGDLPATEVIQDPEGQSSLLRADGRAPLVYLSHRLGGRPELGRQREYPWVTLDALRRMGFNILRSADGGPETYGNDVALEYCARMCGKALDRIDWNGELYALGISMGALTALQMSWKGLFPHPVTAIATIDGAMNLQAIYADPPDRTRRIEEAYGVAISAEFADVSRGHDPFNDFWTYQYSKVPLLAFGSEADAVLPLRDHSEAMVIRSRSVGAASKLVRTTGDHIAPEHFTVATANRVADFFRSAGDSTALP